MHSVKAEGKKKKKSNQQKIEVKDKRERESKRSECFLKYQTSNREEDAKDTQQETDLVKNQRHRRCDKKKR